ncbi:MAG: response regulator [Bacteroidetes bacterium]|nr:response regulator [Bacteroidota bacterium]
MSKDQDDFLKELLNDFKIEGAEHLQAMVKGLLELENDINSQEKKTIVETVFREMHSMKGASRAVNLMQIERLCMHLESVFHEIKNEKLQLSKDMFDVFFQATDTLETMLKEMDNPNKSVSENAISQLGVKLKALSLKSIKHSNADYFLKEIPTERQGEHLNTESHAVEEKAITIPAEKEVPSEPLPVLKQKEKISETETVRIDTAKLYDSLRLAEEMITIKNKLKFHSDQLQLFSSNISNWKRKFSEAASFDNEEELKEKELLKKHDEALADAVKNIEKLQYDAGRTIDEMILGLKKTLLQPFSSLLAVVPRIVRDLSKEYNKEVELNILGSETEIDRRILEAMKDPIVHLVRNCIDHGIESKDERVKLKKEVSGTLTISIASDADQKIKIILEDDGRGINREKLISSAVKSGTIKAEAVDSMNEQEINMLIFASGVSTSPFITDVSGRGLGMAIVLEKITGLGGNIAVESVAHKGTKFTITLPQTLATFKGILVKASESLFMIPTTAIFKALKIAPDDISTVESKNTIRLNNEIVGLVSLADVLGVRKRHSKQKSNFLQGLALQIAQKKLVFVVDEVLGEHEGIVKSLGPQLKHVNNIAGATLLGDGKIVPVLQIAELINAAIGKSFTTDFDHEEKHENSDADVQKRILLAEDSITIRNMMRNYLETAGFDVVTAVDGQDAFEHLQSERFDIVVTDIEMPRMNGIQLTAKIKEHAAFNHLPVVLVTALESKDDRKRGMEAGANAYIIKSSFEKSNLIDTINRLI